VLESEQFRLHDHTHTHTQPFYGSLDFDWNNPGEPIPEITFRTLLDFLVQNEGNTGRCTNSLWVKISMFTHYGGM